MHSGLRLTVLVALALPLTLPVLLVSAPTAQAHAALVRSDPAPSSVWPTPPARVTLTFTEPVEPTSGAVELTGPTGRAVAGVHADAAPGDRRTAIARLPDGLPRGSYRVDWRVLSLDGHPIDGSYTFAIGAPTSPLTSPTRGHAVSLLQVAGRALAACGALTATGLAVFPLLVGVPATRRLRSDLVAPLLSGVLDRLQRPLRWSVAAAVSGTALVALDTVARATGTSPAAVLSDPSRTFEVLASTRTGLLLTARVGVLVVVPLLVGRLAVHWRARTTPPTKALIVRGGCLLTGCAAAVAATFALSSHAASVSVDSTLAVVFDGLHLLAAGAWAGGLVGLALAALPTAARLGARPAPRETGPALVAALTGAFSTLAQLAMLVIITTGAYATLIRTSGLTGFGTSTWGAALLAKLALWAVLLLLAGYTTARIVPAISNRLASLADHRAAVGELRSMVRLELAIAGAVIVLAGLLSAAAPPDTGRPAAQQAATAAPAVGER